MISLWFLEVKETEDTPLKCELTDQTSGHDSLSVAVDITDTRLAGILQHADPLMRELLNLVATSAYKFGYSEGSLDAGVSVTRISTTELFGESTPLMSFRELYQKVFGDRNVDKGNDLEALVAARRAQFQAFQDEIVRHEPGSGVASVDLRGYIGRTNPADP